MDELHRWKREARALRNIVIEDSSARNFLDEMRGLREWHAKNKRQCRQAQNRAIECEAVLERLVWSTSESEFREVQAEARGLLGYTLDEYGLPVVSVAAKEAASGKDKP